MAPRATAKGLLSTFLATAKVTGVNLGHYHTNKITNYYMANGKIENLSQSVWKTL